MTNIDINDLWIPMTRKKPEIYQKCIISTKEYGVEIGIFRDDGIANQIWRDITSSEKNIFCKYYFECEYEGGACPWYTMKEVDAWMPMPATYTKKGAKK